MKPGSRAELDQASISTSSSTVLPGAYLLGFLEAVVAVEVNDEGEDASQRRKLNHDVAFYHSSHKGVERCEFLKREESVPSEQ